MVSNSKKNGIREKLSDCGCCLVCKQDVVTVSHVFFCESQRNYDKVWRSTQMRLKNKKNKHADNHSSSIVTNKNRATQLTFSDRDFCSANAS